MAEMTKCKSCGKEVSKSAKTCPECGAKLRMRGCSKLVLLGVIVVGAIIALVVVGGTTSTNDVSGPRGAEPSKPISDLKYGEIREVADKRVEQETTDVQWKNFYRQHEGKRIRWTGWVEDVSEAMFGGFKVSVDMEPPSKSMSTSDVTFDVPQDVATGLNVDDKITFAGTIKTITLVMGADLTISLENVNIGADGGKEHDNSTETTGSASEERP